MLQIKSPVLYFFLLVLGVSFDFTPNIVNKRSRFSETLLEECLEFVLSKKSNPIILNLSFMLLLAEVDPISKKQSRKRDVLVARGTDYIEIIFILPTKVVILYI